MPSPRPVRHLRLVPTVRPMIGFDSMTGALEQAEQLGRRLARHQTPAAPPPTLAFDENLGDTAEPLVRRAWSAAGEVLGADYRRPAFRLALSFIRSGQQLIPTARTRTWSAAVVWVVAEDAQLIRRDDLNPAKHDPAKHDHTKLTPTRLAADLQVSLPTLRRRAAQIRAALAPVERAGDA